MKLDLASILKKMKKIGGHGPEDGEGGDESDSATDQYDPDLVLEHATEVSKCLYRAVSTRVSTLPWGLLQKALGHEKRVAEHNLLALRFTGEQQVFTLLVLCQLERP